MTPKRRTGRTGGKSQLLEHCVEALHMRRFHTFDTHLKFDQAQGLTGRYVIRGYRHNSLYGTRGNKEALIVASEPSVDEMFVLDDGGAQRVIVEAKWQETSGSVDEKLPYIWLAAQESPILNWVVVLDGAYWRSGRGAIAKQWLTDRSTGDGRRFVVVNRKEFVELADKAWPA